MTPRHDNLRGWLLCAPAAAAMLTLNLIPAFGELISAPPRPLMAELGSWAIASGVVGAQTLAVCGAILLVEAPLAFALALLLAIYGDRGAAVSPGTALAATAAAVAWRWLFGGSIGFAATDASLWVAAALETWRTLPLATLLMYAALRRRAVALGEAARLDGASFPEYTRRVLLPLCRPALAALAALHAIDYLREAPATLISVAAADRAAWTLLVALVALLALRFAAPAGDVTSPP